MPEDPRVRFAAERTLLAWVRTGLGLNVLAAVEYRTVIRRIDRGESYRPPRWSLGLLVAGVLVAVGLAMAAYLVGVSSGHGLAGGTGTAGLEASAGTLGVLPTATKRRNWAVSNATTARNSSRRASSS